MKKLWSTHRALLILAIAVVLNLAICWQLLPRNDWLTNVGFLVLGGLVATLTALLSEQVRRSQLRQDLAQVLYVELADRVSRCCFDMEAPWGPYLDRSIYEVAQMSRFRLRKFTPAEPVVYVACAPQLAVLGAGPAQAIARFYYHLEAWRRDITSMLDEEPSSGHHMEVKDINFLAKRFRQTLRPGLHALEALSPLVGNHLELESTSLALYDEQRASSSPRGQLRERISNLIADV
jgi:hypothetical protein